MANADSKKSSHFTSSKLLGLSLGCFFVLAFQVASTEASTYTVLNTDDAGAGSFRQAIINANANAGEDTIDFDNSVDAGTITLLSELESARSDEELNIDASMLATGITVIGSDADNYGVVYLLGGGSIKGMNIQGPGGGCLVIDKETVIGGTGARDGNKFDGCVRGVSVEYNTGTITFYGNTFGSIEGNTTSGLSGIGCANMIVGGSGAGERNVFYNSETQIRFGNCSDVTIKGNYIGLDLDGVTDQGGTMHGILSEGTNTDIVIGGPLAGERNYIAGNDNVGIVMSTGTTSVIQGNYVGTNAAGTAAVGMGGGIYCASNCTIGGTDAGEGNLIGGAADRGISISGSTGGTVIQGNYIGLNSAGDATIPNLIGIYVENSINVLIGGTDASARNFIAGNTGGGVTLQGAWGPVTGNVIQMNYIGTNVDGDADLGNGANGIEIVSGASNNTVGGAGYGNLISGNTQHGVSVANGTDNLIQGNFIGTSADGLAAIGNAGWGIYYGGTGLIGGTGLGEGNLISGSGDAGIFANGTEVIIEGNLIGTDATGNAAIPNAGAGVQLEGCNSCTVGGLTSASRNIISGNSSYGVKVQGAFSDTNDNSIIGNYIGTNITGNADLGNGDRGVYVCNGPENTIIGVADSGNVISGNGADGIWLEIDQGTSVNGNIVGLAADGLTAMANVGSGIRLNDSNDATIGTANTPAAINFIASNGEHGIWIDNTSTGATIVNNTIGYNTADVQRLNTENAIYINNASNTNTIGGTATGTGNTLAAAAPNSCTLVAANAGDFNAIRANDCSTESDTTFNISRLGASNEATPTPTIDGTSDSSCATGTSAANASIDVFIEGLYESSVTANGAGEWISCASRAEDDNLSVSATNTTNSTSASSAQFALLEDGTAPTVPTVSSPVSGSNVRTSTITLTGTKEAYSSIWIDGLEFVPTDEATTWTVSDIDLVLGANSYSITSKDYSFNTSAPLAYTVSYVGASGTPVKHLHVHNEEPDSESKAGEEEVPEEPVEAQPSSENPSTDTSSKSESKSESSPSQDSSSTTEESPVESFQTRVHEVLDPVIEENIRKDFPSEPLVETKFDDRLFENSFFENTDDLDIPQILIDLLNGGETLTATGDKDGDGAYDWEEILYGGNPNLADTDGDGISDGEELFILGTDTEAWDSDGDGISDATDTSPTEYNPRKVSSTSSSTLDSDHDGLVDRDEEFWGTDPQNADSDGDGISDGDEILLYGTDPNTLTTNLEAISIVNLSSIEEGETGKKLFVGHVSNGTTEGAQTVQAWMLNKDGSLSLIGETLSDENGNYVLMTLVELSVGEHVTFLTTGSTLETATSISRTVTFTLHKYIEKPQFMSIENGSSFTDTRPELSLKTLEGYKIVLFWKSTIYGQTLIADSSEQILSARPVENLELGTHTVTWYAVDLETNEKSSPTQISFDITTPAFVSNSQGTSPWSIVLGSSVVLLSLISMAWFYNKQKVRA